MNGPGPAGVDPVDPTLPGAREPPGRSVSRSIGPVPTGNEAFGVSGGPDGRFCGRPTLPVGSNSTQPNPGKYASTHQWAWAAFTISVPSIARSPLRKP